MSDDPEAEAEPRAAPMPPAAAAAYELGLEREDAGDAEGAAAAFRDYLALDPEDTGGVAVRLAALGQGAAPDRASPAYVATLFDQNAEEFELTLVHALGYGVPELVAQRLAVLGLGPFRRTLDLGCGTGLAGEALEGMVGHLTGVDLARGMLAVAAEKEVYDELVCGDAVGFLEGVEEEPWDLILATDVMPYLGDLAPILDGIARCAAPGAVVAFSTETLPDAAFGDADWTVGPRHRFAHREGPLRAALAARGFGVIAADLIVVRYESGKPVPGHLFVARAAG